MLALADSILQRRKSSGTRNVVVNDHKNSSRQLMCNSVLSDPERTELHDRLEKEASKYDLLQEEDGTDLARSSFSVDKRRHQVSVSQEIQSLEVHQQITESLWQERESWIYASKETGQT